MPAYNLADNYSIHFGGCLMNNHEALRLLIDNHGLTHKEVSALLRCSISSVKHWSNGSNPMPDHMIELLSLKLTSDRA